MFIRNLQKYFAGYKKPARETATRDELRDPRFTCREFVEDALVKEAPGMLGRVFNEFPLLHPIPPALSFKWLTQFDLLIKSMRLTEKQGDITIAVDAKAEEQTQIWLKEVLATACHELLDDDGKLKQEIVDKLELEPVIKAWKNTPQFAQIERQVVYSFCVQLLLGAVQLLWLKKMFPDYVENNGDPRMTGQAVRYIEKSLIDDSTKAWTPFFLKQFELFEESKTVLEKCIAKLRKTPNDELNETIQKMSQESQIIVDAGKTNPVIWKEQVELWIDIMYYFKLRDDLVRVQLIHAMLSTVKDVLMYEILHRSDSAIEKYQLSDDILNKYSECDLFINAPELIESQNDLPAAQLDTLSNILSVSSRFLFAIPQSIFYYAGFYQPATCKVEAIEMDVAPAVKRRSVVS